MKSKASLEIQKWLEEEKIPFVKEKTFPGLVFKRNLRFDFYVNNSCIIEYDGEQHFPTRSHHGWTSKQAYESRKRDRLKNQYLVKNKIPFLRICYKSKGRLVEVISEFFGHVYEYQKIGTNKYKAKYGYI